MPEQNFGLPEIHPSPERENVPPLEFACETKPSSKHPQRNEDVPLTLPEESLFAVFDGVSLPGRGKEAAQVAAKSIQSYFERQKKPQSLNEAISLVGRSLVYANRDVYESFSSKDRGKTTGAIAYFWENPQNHERHLVVAGVGDSRVYIIKDDEITQMTLDDGQIKEEYQDEQRARELQAELSNYTGPRNSKNPSEKEKLLEKFFEKRNIIFQSLGQERPVSPVVYHQKLTGGEIILVCSDGLSDNLTDKEIKEIVTKNSDHPCRLLTKKLMDQAFNESAQRKKQRSKPDDITVIVIKENFLAIGKEVFVRRSDKSIDKNWIITDINPKTGEITVEKPDPDDPRYTLRKILPYSEIKKLNPPRKS